MVTLDEEMDVELRTQWQSFLDRYFEWEEHRLERSLDFDHYDWDGHGLTEEEELAEADLHHVGLKLKLEVAFLVLPCMSQLGTAGARSAREWAARLASVEAKLGDLVERLRAAWAKENDAWEALNWKNRHCPYWNARCSP